MEKKLTIKQIAEMAGVSVAAVSYALNGKKGISDATRKQILDVISNTNYTPNVNSRRLIMNRSFNILLVMDGKASLLNDFFYVEVINSVVEHGIELGYNTVLAKLPECFETSVLKSTLLQHNADGIIFLCDVSDKLEQGIKEIGTPFVVIDSQKREPAYPSVHTDYAKAAKLAVEHLAEMGHTRIAMLDAGDVPEYFLCTKEGYLKALEEKQLPRNENWVQTDIHDESGIEAWMEQLNSEPVLPTAAFCSGDITAINLMNHLQKKGYTLPDDFSVCSIDDIILANYHFPALTTVKIDKTKMGQLAVAMLDKLIQEEETETNITLPAELIVRNSVKKLN